jgi:hypothetical protein
LRKICSAQGTLRFSFQPSLSTGIVKEMKRIAIVNDYIIIISEIGQTDGASFVVHQFSFTISVVTTFFIDLVFTQPELLEIHHCFISQHLAIIYFLVLILSLSILKLKPLDNIGQFIHMSHDIVIVVFYHFN